MRLDQWLWAVRLYESRTLAATAIKEGQVTVNAAPVKPSHEARSGELVAARLGTLTRTLRVLAAPKSRVGAKLVPQFAEDLTPPEEYERQRERAAAPGGRAAGSGRPTKQDRRAIDELLGQWEQENS